MDIIIEEIETLSRVAKDKIFWLKKRADICMYLFWICTIILGISSTSLPFFTFIGFKNLNYDWFVPLLSVIVAFSSFLLQVGNFHMLWKSYRSSEFYLKRVIAKLSSDLRLLNLQEQGDLSVANKKIEEFWSIFSRIEADETKNYFSTINSAATIEKPTNN